MILQFLNFFKTSHAKTKSIRYELDRFRFRIWEQGFELFSSSNVIRNDGRETCTTIIVKRIVFVVRQ